MSDCSNIAMKRWANDPQTLKKRQRNHIVELKIFVCWRGLSSQSKSIFWRTRCKWPSCTHKSWAHPFLANYYIASSALIGYMERGGGKMGSGLATLILDEKKITWKVMCKCERQMRKIWKVLRKILYPPLECFFTLLNLFFGAHTWKTQACTFSNIARWI